MWRGLKFYFWRALASVSWRALISFWILTFFKVHPPICEITANAAGSFESARPNLFIDALIISNEKWFLQRSQELIPRPLGREYSALIIRPWILFFKVCLLTFLWYYKIILQQIVFSLNLFTSLPPISPAWFFRYMRTNASKTR